MLLKLTSVTVLAVLSLSPPQSQSDEVAALKREVQALKAQQAAMERDLQVIKTLLQSLTQPRAQAQPGEESFVNKTIPLTNEPAKGEATAKVTLVEVSDYH
nr:hypothetical protein [Acidobacteriota bacterium]